MKDLKEIVDNVDNKDVIVTLLKDTIQDNNRHNKRMFIANIVLSVSLVVISISAMILVALQNKQYADFLSQFEFESESNTIYQDADEFSNNVNSGITINR